MISLNDKIMIDLETTGVSPGCCVLDIGACTFDLEHTFNMRISHQDSKNRGLEDDPSTMTWWERQSKEAREASFSGTQSVVTSLGAFSDWMKSVASITGARNQTVWGNGADFDLPILAAVYRKVGMRLPWKPYDGRCYRTLKNLLPDISMEKFEGVKHTALADAINQARHASVLLAALRL